MPQDMDYQIGGGRRLRRMSSGIGGGSGGHFFQHPPTFKEVEPLNECGQRVVLVDGVKFIAQSPSVVEREKRVQ